MNPNFKFRIIKSTPIGRVCEIQTPHGTFLTPSFYFCATHGSLRLSTTGQMREEGTTTVLSNTFSLLPYADLIDSMGGIHQFMGWNGPMLTDSGGYQIFSLGYGSVAEEIKGTRNQKKADKKSFIEKINDEGCLIRCPITGKKILLTPEYSLEVQRKIGADFVVTLDECTPFNISYDYTKTSLERSHSWETRSLNRFNEINIDFKQAIYGVVQGGIYEDLRKISCDYINNNNFWGVAIGGCLGKNKEQMYKVVDFTMKNLHKDRPFHLLGIGDRDDIEKLVTLGIDTFDCVSPTRLGRHGVALVPYKTKNHFRINLRNSEYKEDKKPICDNCQCFTCKNHSRAYLHYLFKRSECSIGPLLLTLHNMRQMNDFMAKIRADILNY